MFRCIKIFVIIATFAVFSFAGTGPVSVYGALKACKDDSNKGRICGSGAYANKPVQIKGVSLGWSNTGWESADFFNANTVNAMVDGWKAEIIRVPYGEDNSANETRVKAAIDAAIAQDAYVIIDWHSHNAESQTTSAAAFFSKMARSYGDKGNVIFEVYNEPLAVSWTTIRNYANTVIDTIRKYSDNLILVGTPNWSQNVDAVTSNFISKSNIGYVLHFYAAEHPLSGYTASFGGNTSRQFQTAVTMVLDAGYPVFISEYGTVMANGNGAHSTTNSNAWHIFMNTHKLSSCAWNVNNKNESSAFFKTSFTNPNGQSLANFTTKGNMNESGQYIYDMLISHASSAPWRNETPPPGSSSSGGSTVIDNFEDGDGLANTLEPWYIYTDKDDNGLSTVANSKDENNDYIAVYKDGANWVAGIKNYNLSKGSNPYDPYVALGLKAEKNQINYDLDKCTGGFSYRYNGVAHNFRAEQSDVTDYDVHYKVVSASASWVQATILPSELVQAGWGIPKTRDFKKIKAFAWEIKGGVSANTGSLMIDDFTCLGNMSLPAGSSSSTSGLSSSSSSSVKNSSSSNASGGSSSSSVKNSSSSNVSDDDSNLGLGIDPILTFPRIAFSNSAIASKNGINLAVKNNAVVEVFNLKGNSIRKFNFANGVYTVLFPDLPKGLYIVKISFGSEKKILRVPVN